MLGCQSVVGRHIYELVCKELRLNFFNQQANAVIEVLLNLRKQLHILSIEDN